MKSSTHTAIVGVLLAIPALLFTNQQLAETERLTLMRDYVAANTNAKDVYQQMEDHWIAAVGADSLTDPRYAGFAQTLTLDAQHDLAEGTNDARKEVFAAFKHPWNKNKAERLLDEVRAVDELHASYTGFATSLRWAQALCDDIRLTDEEIADGNFDPAGRAYATFMNELWDKKACDSMVWESN